MQGVLAAFTKLKIRSVLWVPAVVGMVFIVVPYAFATSFKIGVVALAIAAGTYAVGCLFGFLFGVPRALSTAEAQPKIEKKTIAEAGQPEITTVRYAPNTNLEQVSDWLTKLLIGAGLVQLGQLRGALGDLVEFLKPALGNNDAASVIALGLVLYHLVWGFICAWLSTRLWLEDELKQREQDVLSMLTR